jgi:hypothetical protein
MRFVSLSWIPGRMGVIVGARFGVERLRIEQEIRPAFGYALVLSALRTRRLSGSRSKELADL